MVDRSCQLETDPILLSGGNFHIRESLSLLSEVEKHLDGLAIHVSMTNGSNHRLAYLWRALLGVCLPYIGQGTIRSVSELELIGKRLSQISDWRETPITHNLLETIPCFKELISFGCPETEDLRIQGRLLLLLGKTHRLLGNLKEAELCFSHALSCNPNSSELYTWKGELLWTKGLHQQAFLAWRRAIQINKRNEWARIWLISNRSGIYDLADITVDSGMTSGGNILVELIKGFKLVSFDKNAFFMTVSAEAIQNMARDIHSGINNVWFHRLIGIAQYLRKDFAQAAASFSRAIDLEPNWLWSYLLRADAYSRMGNSRGSLIDNNKAIQLYNGSAWAHALQGRIQSLCGLRESALKSLDRAIEIDSGQGWIYAWRAEAKMKFGLSAIRDFSIAARLDPQYARTFAWRSVLLVRQGKITAAAKDVDRAIRLLPVYDFSLYAKCSLLVSRGQLKAALSALKRASKITHRRYWVFHLADIDNPDNGAERSISTLNRLIKAFPKSAFLHAWRGQTNLLLKRYNQAIPDFKHSLHLDPSNGWVHAWLGKSLYEVKERALARKCFSRAIQCGQGLNWAYAWRGHVAMLDEDLGLSLKNLDRAIHIDDRLRPDGLCPRFSKAYSWRAQTLIMLGKWSEAVDDLSRSVAIHSEWKWIYVWLARIFVHQGRYEDAVKNLDYAIERGYDLYALRGEAQRLSGNGKSALEDFQRSRERRAELGGVVLGLKALKSPPVHDLSIYERILREWLLRDVPITERDILKADHYINDACHDVPLFLARAKQRLIVSDFYGAMEDCAKAMDDDPFCVQAMLLKSKALRAIGRNEESHKLLSRVDAILFPRGASLLLQGTNLK